MLWHHDSKHICHPCTFWEVITVLHGSLKNTMLRFVLKLKSTKKYQVSISLSYHPYESTILLPWSCVVWDCLQRMRSL